MNLLEAERRTMPAPPSEPPVVEPPADPAGAPIPAAQSCAACGAAMEAEQDWCLSCGRAAPGRLTSRPDWRTAGKVGALTLTLLAGAAGASYAALSDEAPRSTTPAPAAQVAAAPAAEAATPTTPTTTDAAPPADDPTAEDPAAAGDELPTVEAPSSAGDDVPEPLPAGDDPADADADADADAGVSDPGDDGSTAGADGDAGDATGDATGDTAADGATVIELADDAVKVYDPYGRALTTNDPARAVDGKPATSWFVDPKDPAVIGVGYAIDLGELRGVKRIELTTKTPGYAIEVYATDEAELPPDILDARWSHIRDVTDVGVPPADDADADAKEGEQRIVLGAGTSKYRNLLLWFTAPPVDAPRLRITDLELFG